MMVPKFNFKTVGAWIALVLAILWVVSLLVAV